MVWSCRYFDWIFKGVSRMTELELLEAIYNDVHIIMVIVILDFCRRCLSAWRNNLKGGKR